MAFALVVQGAAGPLGHHVSQHHTKHLRREWGHVQEPPVSEGRQFHDIQKKTILIFQAK